MTDAFVYAAARTPFGRFGGALAWRLVNERMPAEWAVSLGEANERLAGRFSISRERQDEFAARSHDLAGAAWTAGFYQALVTPVDGVELSRDEGIRPGSSPEKLSGLKPSFRPVEGGSPGPTCRRSS